MLWAFLALGLAPSTNVQVDELPNIRLESDSAAVIAQTKGGYVLSADASGKLLEGEKDMLAETLERPEEAMGANSLKVTTDREVQPLLPGTLRFNLVDHRGQMLLVIQNGLPQSFTYTARIGRGSDAKATDVCQLLPETRSFEHWPYKFDWIEITDLRPIAYNPGEPPRCD